MLLVASDDRYDKTIVYPVFRPVTSNRNHIAKFFLSEPFDFLLMIDSDNPPIQSPLELVELDKDIIGCATPIYRGGCQWNAFMRQKNGYAPIGPGGGHTGLERVDAVGFGCVLIARRVIEKVQPAPFNDATNEDGTKNEGHDLLFCHRARESGFEVYCHFGFPCQHFVEIDLYDLIQRFQPAKRILTATTDQALKAVGSDRRLFDRKGRP